MASRAAGGDSNAGGASSLSSVELRLMNAAADDRTVTVSELGGRRALESEADQLMRSPMLPELARSFVITVAETAGGDGDRDDLQLLVQIVLDGLSVNESILAFADTLEVLLNSGEALGMVAEQLSKACLSKAAQRRQYPALAGLALEGALRLALGSWVPEYDLLGTLVRLHQPESHLFSRHALRCLGVAYEHWRDVRLVEAMEMIAGLKEPASDDIGDEIGLVESDAALELGYIALLDALTAPSLDVAKDHLRTAYRRFAVARTDEDRVDARLMATAVDLLTKQLPENDSSGTSEESAEDLMRLADELVAALQEHQLGYIGLDNWRGARLDAEVAWVGLARDVAVTARALTQRSWYSAARTLTDVLAVYQASRCAEVLSNIQMAGLRQLLTPRVTEGIGRNAALLTHLEDHIRALEFSVEEGLTVTSQSAEDDAELKASRQLLEAARARYVAAGRGSPKFDTAADPAGAEQYPLLSALLGSDLAPIAKAGPDATAAIEAALAEQDSESIPSTDSLVLSEIFSDCQRQLSRCLDYRNAVKRDFDQVLILLLRFMHFRAQRSRSRSGTAYLFRANALERDLANDVETFLASSAVGYLVHTEVRDIGGGRVDVAIFYESFTLVIELKREYQDVSPEGQRVHLLQAAAYQDSDVALGFLLVLDLRERTGPPPHLRANVKVIVLDDEAIGGSRYIIMLVVPGNRRSPSSVSWDHPGARVSPRP